MVFEETNKNCLTKLLSATVLLRNLRRKNLHFKKTVMQSIIIFFIWTQATVWCDNYNKVSRQRGLVYANFFRIHLLFHEMLFYQKTPQKNFYHYPKVIQLTDPFACSFIPWHIWSKRCWDLKYVPTLKLLQNCKDSHFLFERLTWRTVLMLW
jgi:hypothetical protein